MAQLKNVLRILVVCTAALNGQAAKKALVGGTLIDGYGGPPIRNSVILIEGERIQAVGQMGTLPIPPGASLMLRHASGAAADAFIATRLAGGGRHVFGTLPIVLESAVAQVS